jgi:predicted porin
MTSQIIAETLSWTPWSRLSLQLGFNYVLSDTKTPASDYTKAVLDAQNNFWTLNFNSTFVVDNKTDLNLGYFYYESDNLQLNSAEGLPLGAAARESCVTAMLTRRLTPHLRLNLKYGYSHLNDLASGGYNNYDAQVVYSSLQYRF